MSVCIDSDSHLLNTYVVMGLEMKSTLSALDKPSQGGRSVNRHNGSKIATAVVEAELRAAYRALCARNREEASGCQGRRVTVGKWGRCSEGADWQL